MTERPHGTPEEVRKFGLLFAVILTAVAVYARASGSASWFWWVAGGAAFLLSGHFAPALLRPIYLGWMKFAVVLAWINTRILLGLFFYCVMTPIGLILRLTGKDLLDVRMDAGAKSYWKKRETRVVDRERYSRLF